MGVCIQRSSQQVVRYALLRIACREHKPLGTHLNSRIHSRHTMNTNFRGDPKRIAQLAGYKRLDPKFVEDRRSVYWTDRPVQVQGKDQLSSRQAGLAFPKLPHRLYQGDRPSPIWQVSNSAMRAHVSNRVKELSCPKLPHGKWQKDKPVQTVVRLPALKHRPTGRIVQLSQPKAADSRYINPSISLENLAELTLLNYRHPSQRPEQNMPEWAERLSESKPTPVGYRADRPIRWVIHKSTLEANTPARVDELSKIRRVGKQGGPDVNEVEDPYAVSRAAKKASASSRVSELAVPIARKVRQKK